mmetsp:Transcript_7504/g.19972  ORF Transcript_7504/g.19972 Transcript_7504/m.19972 type:complete len:318 (+) Transcript_7504:109-1062(+)|eukprot:CAMPEP_0202342560 /NCGR_PEP_ID=MMETSP1126-20121109/3073_1 /ASSEMBLY_ACC=CAM_ASM_000457 /TAXON_ID=3047 /ORGANISM="Dunaliella tertiolecta, Strain CCMP1320" /LENGTH=317 /DNA_ID=CAMNT_0048933535 /DNA_START=875 /DNA_END=1828 /DNA_ORIENTATION=-
MANQQGNVQFESDAKALQKLKDGSEELGANWGSVKVSNIGIKTCIQLQALWDVPPECIYAIFTYPDNSSLFRDVKCVGGRNVTKAEPNFKEVEVEQRGELRVLWICRQYSTWLKVTEDARDSSCLRTNFDLMRSDVLQQFSGKWELRPVVDGATGKVVGAQGLLSQEIQPKGIPSFLKHIPLMDGLLRGVTVRVIKRLMEDIDSVVKQVKAGKAKGQSQEEVLRQLCGKCNEAGHANGAVSSFAVGDEDSQEEEDEGDAEAEKVTAAFEHLHLAEEKAQANGEAQQQEQQQRQPGVGDNGSGEKAGATAQEEQEQVH